jgi:hypothetical protein
VLEWRAAASIFVSGGLDLDESHGGMVVKRRGILAAVAAVAVSAAVVPSPALAAKAATAVTRARQSADLPAAPTLVADQAMADREFVRWLSVHDPRAFVRSAARSAQLSGRPAAIAEFLASGYESAERLASDIRARHLDYANRMASTHAAQFYPWVNAAARRAAIGTDAELAEFSSAGYAAALAKDRAKVPYDDGAALVTPADRVVVADLSVNDPGAAVRERAAGVVTDAEVAEFLRYGWVSAAGIDSDRFRAQYVAEERVLWSAAKDAVLGALAADQTEAAQAWTAVSTHFADEPAGWTGRERFARDRADAWAQILVTAAASPSPLWASLAARGAAVRKQWAAEATHAAERAVWWTDLIGYAAAAAAELSGPIPYSAQRSR